MAEKRVIELEIKEKGISSLKEQLASAKQSVQDLADRFGASSQYVADAADKVRSLEKEIKQTNKTLKSVGFEGKFNAISGSITGVLNGLQAFQGSLGLIGVEGKDVESVLLKVQSVMALTQGIEGVFAAQTSFKKLKGIIGDAATSGITAFKGMTTASKAFIATGIGLVIAAVAYAISEMSAAAEEGAAQMEGLQKATESLNDELSFSTKVLSDYSKKAITDAKLRGASEKELLDIELEYAQKSINARFKNANERIKANAKIRDNENATSEQIKKANSEIYKAQTELMDIKREAGSLSSEFALKEKELSDAEIAKNKEKAKAAKDAAKESAKARQEALDKIKEAEKEYLLEGNTLKENEILAEQEKYSELIKLAEKNNYDTTTLRNALRDSLNTIDNKYDDIQRANDEKRAKEKKELDIAEFNRKEALRREEIATEETFFDEYNAALLTQQQTEEQVVTDKYFKLIEGATKYGLDITELEAKQKKELSDINDKYRKEEEEKEKIAKDQRIQAVQNTLSTIANLAQLFAGKSEKQQKKAFQIQKAVNIANATIDTYKAATGAFASLSSIPVVGPVLGAAAAAAAIAAGLVNVKNIASQKFEGGGSMSAAPAGGGGGGGGGAGASNVITPNFNIVGNAQATNPLAGLGSQPLQAYVVSGEVTSAQSLDRNRVNYATFG